MHYVSRYWTQRTLWESDWEGRSPIADPDYTPACRRRVHAAAARPGSVGRRAGPRLPRQRPAGPAWRSDRGRLIPP